MFEKFGEHLTLSTNLAVRQQPELLGNIKCSLAQKCGALFHRLSRMSRLIHSIGSIEPHAVNDKLTCDFWDRYTFQGILFEISQEEKATQFDLGQTEFVEKIWNAFGNVLNKRLGPTRWIEWIVNFAFQQFNAVSNFSRLK